MEVSMATTPVPIPAPKPVAPAASASTPQATIEKDIVWIRGHILASLLAIALIVGSIIGGVSLFESLIEKHDARVAAAQQAKEGVDTATQAAFMTQLNQIQAANATRDAAQTALIQSLVRQMAQQHAVTAKQIQTDATLDATAAAVRLVTQTKASPSDVTVSNDTVSMTLPLTRTVIANLDLLPQAQSDVTNVQGQLSAQQILTSDAKVELDKATQVIASDKTELIATVKADSAACAVSTNDAVQKQATKDSKRNKWLIIFGAIAGGFIGHSL
jgi:phage FluMu protein gp41